MKIKEKIKLLVNDVKDTLKRNKKTIVKAVVKTSLIVAPSVVAIKLYGNNQKLKGELANQKAMLSESQKAVEKFIYLLGKHHQKKYGNH